MFPNKHTEHLRLTFAIVNNVAILDSIHIKLLLSSPFFFFVNPKLAKIFTKSIIMFMITYLV